MSDYVRGVWDCLNYVIRRLETHGPERAAGELTSLKNQIEEGMAEAFLGRLEGLGASKQAVILLED